MAEQLVLSPRCLVVVVKRRIEVSFAGRVWRPGVNWIVVDGTTRGWSNVREALLYVLLLPAYE